MFTKTALTAAIIFGTASFAFAQEADQNLLNRYPSYNMSQSAVAPGFQSRSVALGQGQVIARNESYIDRASQTNSGGY